MTPTELFENAMDWLRKHYEDFGFCLAQRDVELGPYKGTYACEMIQKPPTSPIE